MKPAYYLFLTFLLFIINGCGGGGGSENPLPLAPSASQMTQLNSTNSDKVVLSSYKAVLGSNEYQDLDILQRQATTQSLRSLRALSLRTVSKRVEQGSCESGNVDVNRISESETEVNYNNCVIDGTTYNGYAHIYDYETWARVVFKYFKAANAKESIDITQAEFVIKEDIFEIKGMYAKYKNSSDRISFLNYNSKVITDEYNNWIILYVKGYINTNCTNGYVLLQSSSEIKIYTDESGYIEGTLTISANSKQIIVDFFKDVVTIIDIDGVSESMSLKEFQDAANSLYCP